MERKRYLGKLQDASLLSKTSDGLTCCRWCDKGVMKPRRTICSKECEHELKLRMSNRYMRDCTYLRDKGICSICCLDTKLIAREALLLEGFNRLQFLINHNRSSKRKIWVRKHGGGLWDADHIIPVKDGGGLCGLDNIRTLCIPCHKKITFSNSKSKQFVF